MKTTFWFFQSYDPAVNGYLVTIGQDVGNNNQVVSIK